MSGLSKAGARRLVTFVDVDGRSRFEPEEEAPRVSEYEATPGMRTSVLWATYGMPTFPVGVDDPVPALRSFHPAPGGSIFLTLTIPPDAVFDDPAFDPIAAGAEQLQLAPGIAECMEPNAPGFHTTHSIDYAILLSGELWLALDEDERCLAPGDVVIQLGARHAWQNRGREPATLAVVLLGAAS